MADFDQKLLARQMVKEVAIAVLKTLSHYPQEMYSSIGLVLPVSVDLKLPNGACVSFRFSWPVSKDVLKELGNE